MLGIIFTGGESPAPDVVKRIIKTVAEDTLFIAADSGLTIAENAGIKPDWLVGDFDSLPDASSALAAYPQDRIIRSVRDKDFSDTEIAFSLAAEKGCDSIWIIGGGGGRLDHLFAIRSMFERDVFPSRWITANEDIHCISREQGAGNREQVAGKKEQGAGNKEQGAGRSLNYLTKKGAIVSVFPLGSGPWEAKSEGLKWQLTGLPWDRGFFGLSNVALGSEISITAHLGRFMIVLQLDK